MVAPAPAVRGSRTHGHRIVDRLGMAFAQPFRHRAGPNHEKAWCFHPRTARELVWPYRVHVVFVQMLAYRWKGCGMRGNYGSLYCVPVAGTWLFQYEVRWRGIRSRKGRNVLGRRGHRDLVVAGGEGASTTYCVALVTRAISRL